MGRPREFLPANRKPNAASRLFGLIGSKGQGKRWRGFPACPTAGHLRLGNFQRYRDIQCCARHSRNVRALQQWFL